MRAYFESGMKHCVQFDDRTGYIGIIFFGSVPSATNVHISFSHLDGDFFYSVEHVMTNEFTFTEYTGLLVYQQI